MSKDRWGPIESDAERAFVGRSLKTSFGLTHESIVPAIDEAGPERQRVFRDERGEPAGSALVVWAGQWFGGRPVPMAGVRAVAVPPERRGTGVASAMMEALLREAHDKGFPLSTLYAATQALYRRSGYEQAGHRSRIMIDPARLRARSAPGTRVRPADFDSDHAAMAACQRAMAREMPGSLDRDAYLWSLIRSPRRLEADTLVVEDADRVCGVLTARLERAVYPQRGFVLWVSDWASDCEDGARGVLAALAGYGSVVTEIRLWGGPSHPVLMLLDEQKYRIEHEEHWMTRIVRLPEAIEARGYAPGVRARAEVAVRDPLFAGNDGRWVIEVADGVGRCVRGGSGAVELDIGAMASVYTGYASPGQLRLIGRVRGDEAQARALGAAFAGPTPSMVDFF
jgi:predicted acetyltransferase